MASKALVFIRVIPLQSIFIDLLMNLAHVGMVAFTLLNCFLTGIRLLFQSPSTLVKVTGITVSPLTIQYLLLDIEYMYCRQFLK